MNLSKVKNESGTKTTWKTPNPGERGQLALLVVDSNNNFIGQGIKVDGHGKKMADMLNCYDARLQSEN
jgi:hypothetical protein